LKAGSLVNNSDICPADVDNLVVMQEDFIPNILSLNYKIQMFAAKSIIVQFTESKLHCLLAFRFKGTEINPKITKIWILNTN